MRALTVVVAAAMATCWLHLAVVAVRRHLIGEFGWKWWLRDQVLLSSVGYLIVFLALGAIPIVVHTVWPRRYSLAALIAILTGIGAFAVLLVFTRIAPWAWSIVALGVALQLYRLAASNEVRAWRWARRIAVAGSAAAAIVAGASAAASTLRERQAMAALPATPAGAMNVLLIILDTVRAQSLSLYGYAAETSPRLVERAQGGVVFENAYSTAPWTLPSHASMFTGRYASQTSADWASPLDGTHPTLAQALRGRGYATGGFVANHVATPRSTGLARGFIRYSDTKYTPLEMALNTTLAQTTSVVDTWQEWQRGSELRRVVRTLAEVNLRPKGNYTWHDPRPAQEITGEFLLWQESLGSRPFFAFLNLFDAHEPREPPPMYRTMFDAASSSHGRYLGAIRYMDDALEELLRELQQRGVLERTLVVIASDHGEAFGEHGQRGHGNGLFLPQLRVPLLMLNAPGAPPGSRVSQGVSLIDLPATILDLTGTPNMLGIGGVSLRSLIDGTSSALMPSAIVAELNRGINLRRLNPLSFTDYKSVIDDTLHVIRSNAGEVQAFAHRTDRAEQSNLATDSVKSVKAESWMQQVLARNGIGWRAHALPPDTKPPGRPKRR